ncbi:adenylosuccinate synthetase, partial [bacterium]|nr:adenylosuccinate synthetase [bacterium]
MPVTVVVGGQFGSEGKGKIAHYLAEKYSADVAIRIGGSNSGHTAIDQAGNACVLRQLPTAALRANTVCVLGPGSYIDAQIFLEEVERLGLEDNRVLIDPNAVLISPEHKTWEAEHRLRENVGSTLSGTGAALINRVSRDGAARLAKDDPQFLERFVRDTNTFLRRELSRDRRIILEGTQGFGLSILHSPEYPYVTSRDTTAASFISEAGLSPFDVDEIVLVLRAFPIRVAGNSGVLSNETTWSVISAEAGANQPLEEFTSATGRRRRIGRFDASIVRKAIDVNLPSKLALNHLDYVDFEARRLNRPTPKIDHFLEAVEAQIGREISLLGFGPNSVVDRQAGRT